MTKLIFGLVAILTILIAVLSPLTVHAANVQAHIQVISFDAEANTVLGVMSIDNEMITPVKIDSAAQISTGTFTTSLEISLASDNTFSLNNQTYNLRSFHQLTRINGSTLDSVHVQFQSSVNDGNADLVRMCDAYSKDGIGYLVQSNALVSFTCFNNELITQHKLYLSLISR